MITCVNNKCGYAYGWTHRGGKTNHFIDPKEGELFRLENGLGRITARQVESGKELEVCGCPRCGSVFMAVEVYEDDNTNKG